MDKDFIKITEQNSKYDRLEHKSVDQLTAIINKEDKGVAFAVEEALPQVNALRRVDDYFTLAPGQAGG